MARYLVVTDSDVETIDAEGQMVTIPAGSVVNVVEWDGVSEWSPPAGTHVVPAS